MLAALDAHRPAREYHRRLHVRPRRDARRPWHLPEGPVFLRACGARSAGLPLPRPHPRRAGRGARRTGRRRRPRSSTRSACRAIPGMQGRSLWEGIAAGAGRSTREDVYCEYYNAMPWHSRPAHAAGDDGANRAAQDRAQPRRRLGRALRPRSRPRRDGNLWDDPAAVPVKLAMLQRACDRMAFTADPLPLRRSAW